MIRIIVRGQSASCVKDMYEHITTGLVGKKIYFAFSEEWDGYAKTAVFTGSDVTKDMVITGDVCTIPPECLTQADGTLVCGIYGYKDGEVTPTIYCTIDRIKRGADPSGDPSADPTPLLWEQLQAQIGDLAQLDTEAKGDLVAAINEAFAKGADSEEINKIVAEYLQEYPPAPGKDGEDGKDGINGKDGADGKDGVSITAASIDPDGNLVIEFSNGPSHSLGNVVGENGKDGADGRPGEDGHTPVKGEDYWTEEDRQEIVNDVLAALPAWEGGSY